MTNEHPVEAVPLAACLEYFEKVDFLIEKLQTGQDDIRKSLNDIRDALTGTELHPNGLMNRVALVEVDVRSVNKEMRAIKDEIASWRNRAIGFGLGVGVVGGFVGGVGGALVRLWTGG